MNINLYFLMLCPWLCSLCCSMLVLSLNYWHHVMSARPPYDMLAADLQTCRCHITRHVGNMSNVWLAQDDIGRHLSQCARLELASQTSYHEICRHVTKIDSQSWCWRHVGCCPKQGDTEWREDMSANMSRIFSNLVLIFIDVKLSDNKQHYMKLLHMSNVPL
jgi:hypothetical protein